MYLGTFIEGGYIVSIKDVKINDRFFLNGDRLRGFKNLGIGPRDTSTGDALGGEIYYIARNELNFPLGLPDDLGLSGLAFIDIGSIYNTNSSSSLVKDENSEPLLVLVNVDFSFRSSQIFLNQSNFKRKL